MAWRKQSMKCEIETSFGDIIRLEVESIRFINQSDIMGMMLKDGRKLLIDTSKKSFRFKEVSLFKVVSLF